MEKKGVIGWNGYLWWWILTWELQCLLLSRPCLGHLLLRTGWGKETPVFGTTETEVTRWDQRIVQVGGGLWRSPGPSCCPNQVPLDQVPQGLGTGQFSVSPRTQVHQIFWAPWWQKEFSPCTQPEFPMWQLCLMPPLPVHLWGQSVSPLIMQLQTVGRSPAALSFQDWANTVLSPSPPMVQPHNSLWWVNMGLAPGRQHVYRTSSLFSCAASQIYSRAWFPFSYQLVLNCPFFLPFCATSPTK